MDLKYFIMPNKRKRALVLILPLCLHLGSLINQASSTDKPAKESQSSQHADIKQTVVVGQSVELECTIRPAEEAARDDELSGGVPGAHLIDAEMARGQPEAEHESRAADSIQLILWYHSSQLATNESSRLQRPIYSVDARWRPHEQQQAPTESDANQLGDDRLVPVGANQLNYYYSSKSQQQQQPRSHQGDRNNASRWNGRHYAAAKLAHRLSFRLEPELGRAYLSLARVEVADAGLYRCRVDFERARTRYQLSQLEVINPLRQVEIAVALGSAPSASASPSPLALPTDRLVDGRSSALKVPELLEVNEDQTMRLECEAKDGYPEAQLLWWRLDWPAGAGVGVASGARLTQLSAAPHKQRSVLFTTAGSVTDFPTMKASSAHLATWMAEHLRKLLEVDQQATGEVVVDTQLAKRLEETLSGLSKKPDRLWYALASKRAVAFICGASNTFGKVGPSAGKAPDKFGQIRPLFRSILVGQANAKPRWIQIYLVSRKHGQQSVKLTRINEGQSLHLNLAGELASSDERQLQLACRLGGFWPKATVEWRSSLPGRADSRGLVSDSAGDLESLIAASQVSSADPIPYLASNGSGDAADWPQQWSSIRVHNISIHEHGSIIKCIGRNDFYLAKLEEQAHSLGKQRTSGSIISGHAADHDADLNTDGADLDQEEPLRKASLSAWIKLNITHAPLVKLELLNGRDYLDRLRAPKEAKSEPKAASQICGQISRDGELVGADGGLDKCATGNRPSMSATLSPGESVILTCSIGFANPALIEPIEWSFKRWSVQASAKSREANDIWRSIARFTPFGSARILPEESRQTESDSSMPTLKQRLELRLADEQSTVANQHDLPVEFSFRCAARNQLGSSSSELARILLGLEPRCKDSPSSLSTARQEAGDTQLATVQCPVISDHNSSTYRYHYYYYYHRNLKSQQMNEDTSESNERLVHDNDRKQVNGSHIDRNHDNHDRPKSSGHSFISHSPVIQTSDLRPVDSLSALYNGLLHEFNQEIVIKCSAADKFGSNDDNPCEIRLNASALSPSRPLRQPGGLAPSKYSLKGSLNDLILSRHNYARERVESNSQLEFDLFRKNDTSFVRHLTTLANVWSSGILLELDDADQFERLDRFKDEHLIVVRPNDDIALKRNNLTIFFKLSTSSEESSISLPSINSDGHGAQDRMKPNVRAGYRGVGSAWVTSSSLVYSGAVLAFVIICYITVHCGNKSSARFNRSSRPAMKNAAERSSRAGDKHLMDSDSSTTNNGKEQQVGSAKQQVQSGAATELLYLVASDAANGSVPGSSIAKSTDDARVVNELHPQAVYHNTAISARPCPVQEQVKLGQPTGYSLEPLSPSASPINVLIIDSLASDSSHLSTTTTTCVDQQEQPAILVLDGCAEHANFLTDCHLIEPDQAQFTCTDLTATLRRPSPTQARLSGPERNSSASSSSPPSTHTKSFCANYIQSQCIRLPANIVQSDTTSPASINNIELNSLGELTITDESSSFIPDHFQSGFDHSATVRRRTLTSGSPLVNHNDWQRSYPNKPAVIASHCVECQRLAQVSSSLLKLNQDCQCYHFFDKQGPEGLENHAREHIPSKLNPSMDTIRSVGSRNKTGNERVRFLDF